MLRKFNFPAVALHSMMKQVRWPRPAPAPAWPRRPLPAPTCRSLPSWTLPWPAPGRLPRPAKPLSQRAPNSMCGPEQKERFAALAKFKSSIYRILIATDVASR